MSWSLHRQTNIRAQNKIKEDHNALSLRKLTNKDRQTVKENRGPYRERKFKGGIDYKLRQIPTNSK